MARKSIILPFTICVDSNESAPWTFLGHADHFSRPIVTKTETVSLWTQYRRNVQDSEGGTHNVGLADYSIVGHELNIQIERKSLSDLVSTMTSRFRRFEAEVRRLHEDCDYSAVIVEAGLSQLRAYTGPGRSPASIEGTIRAWKQRYPACHWYLIPGRANAERMALEILRRWWGDFKGGKLPGKQEATGEQEAQRA